MKTTLLIIGLIFLLSCNAQDVCKSYGYFDENDYYIELYFRNDSAYICNAAIPFINAYKIEKENEIFVLYEDTDKVAYIRLKKVNEVKTIIFVNDIKYTGFNIENDVKLPYYYSNDKKLLDEFAKLLFMRKQKHKSLR